MSTVDRDQFKRIVGNLLAQKPTPKLKTGKRKSAASVIPPVSEKAAAKSGHSERRDL